MFGVLSIISGLLTFIYPETATTDLITSLDEAEEYFRSNMAIAKFFKSKLDYLNIILKINMQLESFFKSYSFFV